MSAIAAAAQPLTHEQIIAKLSPLASRLDLLYQEVLSKIEEQIYSASDINSSINAILQRHTEENVLKWNPDLALSPKAAFASFAEAMAKTAAPYLSVTSNKTVFRYLDLIDWSDSPIQAGRSSQQFQVDKVNYARKKRITQFLDDLLIRYRPESMPEHAMERATTELAKIFSIVTPVGTVIPITRAGGPCIIRYWFYRNEDELLWYIIPRHYSAMLRASNAIATISLLNNIPGVAVAIGDMLNAIEAQLTKSMMKYEAGDAFHAGTFLRVVINRDHAEFHFGKTVFDALEAEVLAHISDVKLIFQ